eukprot:CAMPEP_0116577416 /NCGR_PEP_ID=MMETSP0397-20121206/21139_1 /TAXON_ID=216820 /ORGANISM="Cyclophora tenuis, Strain ECT3854" /LENGTH=57 /DNA_ID=CAMNT_0004106693 /DNA_START=566 /DNA_END=740 /DNA_ORIENTATION=-
MHQQRGQWRTTDQDVGNGQARQAEAPLVQSGGAADQDVGNGQARQAEAPLVQSGGAD